MLKRPCRSKSKEKSCPARGKQKKKTNQVWENRDRGNKRRGGDGKPAEGKTQLEF